MRKKRKTPESRRGKRGPRPNSRFKAAADLYRMDGTLFIRISEVVEVVD